MPFGTVREASRTCPWHCLRGAHVQPVGPGLLAVTCPLGTDHEAPAFSKWVLPCPLALSARHLVHALGTVYEAPRSASGCRPSRSLMLFGIVCEASHAGQLHGELILAMTTWCCQLFDHSIGAVKIVEKRARNVSSTRSKTVLLLTFTKDEQGGRFRTQPWYSGRCYHARLSKKFVGIQTAIKHVRREHK